MAAAGVFSLAIIGVAGVLAAWAGAPFGVFPVALVTCGVGALAYGLARSGRRGSSGLRATLDAWDRTSLLTGSAVIFGAIAVTLPPLLAMGSLDALSQSYDGVFHLNAVAYVLDTGD